MDLLRQFELILESDKLIDEVGFLHPTQLSSLGETASCQLLDSSTKVSESVPLHYDTTALWIRDHKLAISTDVLSELYFAAKEAFFTSIEAYKMFVKSRDAFIGDINHLKLLEYEILKHTKALLILCCSFNGAWNCSRKLVLSTKHELALLLDDLQLSSLILSFSPKCESAWNHRRWVIKKVAELPELHEIVREESELVKKLAEKSKMNYRAWSHRCWLISYMTKAQVLDELDKSRKWAELHVADSSCFHHRRQLVMRLLEYHSDPEESCFKCDTCFTLKEELDWDEILIKRYIGREALWIHRRLLSLCWITHLRNNMEVVATDLEYHRHDSSSLDIFLDKELNLVQSCLNTSDDEFDDNRVQSQHAATYVLWIKEFVDLQMFEKMSNWLEDKKSILLKIKTENNLRWVRLPSI